MNARSAQFAAHEAGHAVVATHMGVRVSWVRLQPRQHPDWAGVTTFRGGRFPGWIVAGLVYAAGPAADLLTGDVVLTRKRRRPVAWKVDFERIARRFTLADQDWLVASACQLLRGPCAVAWGRVRAALAIQDLTGDQVQAAFHGPIDLD